jgi:hypothetical protein
MSRPTDKPESPEEGHNPGFCEKCWSWAYMRTLGDPSRSQYEHYLDVLNEQNFPPARRTTP